MTGLGIFVDHRHSAAEAIAAMSLHYQPVERLRETFFFVGADRLD